MRLITQVNTAHTHLRIPSSSIIHLASPPNRRSHYPLLRQFISHTPSSIYPRSTSHLPPPHPPPPSQSLCDPFLNTHSLVSNKSVGQKEEKRKKSNSDLGHHLLLNPWSILFSFSFSFSLTSSAMPVSSIATTGILVYFTYPGKTMGCVFECAVW
mgnify:CR=1 FL=1